MAKQTFHEVEDAELLDELVDSKDELFKLRFQHATGQLSSHSRLGEVHKKIARIQTELRAREIAAAEALASSSGQDEENR